MSATSRQLRCLVHDQVTSITIVQYRERDTQYQFEHLQLLVSGRWPCLQCLKIEYREKPDTQAIRQLNKTASLDLSINLLGVEAMSQLVLGNWPALKHLELSHNKLDTTAIALLAQADWPLEVLQLGDNRIDVEAVKILTAAQWPLRQLDLGQYWLDGGALLHLCSGRWPDLQTLVLARNCLGARVHPTAQLCQTDWQHLVSVNLSNCLLFNADILLAGALAKAVHLDLSCNGLDEVSMTHVVKSMWPELKCLYLGNNLLNDAAGKVLSHNYWHKLEYLDLQFNVFLTQDAASLLSIEQRRVAVC